MKKRAIVLLMIILFFAVVVSRFTELKQLQATLAQGKWTWLLAALVSQIIYYVAFTGTYQAAFYTAGISARIRELLPLTLGALFVNVVVPAGGAGGGAGRRDLES